MWDGTEYVELYNTTDGEISLQGWQLMRQQSENAEKLLVTFGEEARMAARSFFLIEKNESATTVPADVVVPGLTLLNTGEQVILKDSNAEAIDIANQIGSWFAGANTADGIAMERLLPALVGSSSSAWYTSSTVQAGRAGTPRQSNSEPVRNTAPHVQLEAVDSAIAYEVLTFAADDSTDDEGDTLAYAWDFGDGQQASGVVVTHQFTAAGTYHVSLSVSDGTAEVEVTHAVVVSVPAYTGEIVINEALANPSGDDTAGEYIELWNVGESSVDLSGWQLDDGEGGSTPYRFGATTTLAADSLAVFWRPVTKIALNNTSDSIRLLDPAGEVQASVIYDEATEGVSLNRIANGEYSVSTTTTPGTANIISAPSASEDEDTEEAIITGGRVAGTVARSVVLKDIREEEAGSVLTTEGVISAPPGVLGAHIVYVAGSGIQVFFSQDAWPTLRLGDVVRMTGTLASARGEARLKIAAATDLVRLREGPPPTPHEVLTGDVDEALEGYLVTVRGHVTETDGNTFYIDDDSGEVKIYIPAISTIDKPPMKKGTAVTITGVVSETTSGYRVMPRFQEDIRLGLVAGLTTFPATGRSAALPPFVSLIPALLVVSVTLVSAKRAHEPLITYQR